MLLDAPTDFDESNYEENNYTADSTADSTTLDHSQVCYHYAHSHDNLLWINLV